MAEVIWRPREFLRRLREHRGILDAARTKMLTLSQLEIRNNIVKAITDAKTIDRGLMRASFSPGHPMTATRFLSASRAAVGSRVHYAIYMDRGTRPHWPPVQPIREWVKRKRIAIGEEQVKQVAFLISRKIARFGIKGRHFMKAGLENSLERVKELAREMATSVIEAICK
ncbi:MAG: hypothetical protein AB7E55_01230 [Pigmentiphaga sp.]